MINIVFKVIVETLMLYANLSMFGITVDFSVLLSVYNLNRIISLVPFTIGGLGVLEGGVSLMLKSLGYNYNMILSSMITLRILTFVVIGILFIFVIWGKSGNMESSFRNDITNMKRWKSKFGKNLVAK